MGTCPHCGKDITDDAEYCPNCNTKLAFEGVVKDSDGKPILSYEDINANFTGLNPLPKRNEYFWFILTLFSGGLIGVIYLVINFKDLNKLNKFPKTPQVESIETTVKSFLFGMCTCSIVTLGLFILFYPFYRKFQLLYDYFEQHPIKQQTKIISGGGYAIISTIITVLLIGGLFIGDAFNLYSITNQTALNVMFAISIVCYSFSIGLYLLLMYFNLIWQQAFNERADIVNKYIQGD
ncbi:MAG: zinc ribbon domain-containing protein [Candidatus Thorarchaeota archaeon]